MCWTVAGGMYHLHWYCSTQIWFLYVKLLLHLLLLLLTRLFVPMRYLTNFLISYFIFHNSNNCCETVDHCLTFNEVSISLIKFKDYNHLPFLGSPLKQLLVQLFGSQKYFTEVCNIRNDSFVRSTTFRRASFCNGAQTRLKYLRLNGAKEQVGRELIGQLSNHSHYPFVCQTSHGLMSVSSCTLLPNVFSSHCLLARKILRNTVADNI